MSRGTRRSDRIIAVVLAVVMVLSIPVVFATAGVAAPDPPDPDGTTTGETPADNTTEETSADTTIPTDASVWETADSALAEQQGDASLAREQLNLVQNLEAIATDTSRSQRDQALDTADAVLEQRKGWAASEDKPLSPSMAPKFEAQQTNLDGARRILETNEELQDAEGLARAVPLAKQGTKLQAAQADDSITMTSDLPAVETQNHASPSAATLDLMERYGVTPTAEDRATMQALDDLPEPTRSELTDFLDAFLAFQRTTAEGDVTRVFAARNQLLDETKDLNDAIENTDGPGLATPQDQNLVSTSNPFQVGCVDTTQPGGNQPIDDQYPSAIPGGDSNDDIRDQRYHFCVLQVDTRLSNDNTYDHNTVVLIDAGGSDTYNMNAGGTNLDDNSVGPSAVDNPGGNTCPIPFVGIGPNNDCDKSYPVDNRVDADVAAALADLGSGDDTYERTDHPGIGHGQRGGAAIGSGFLVDEGGSDTYGESEAYGAGNATNGTNGGASALLPAENDCCRDTLATGFLLDAGDNTNTEEYNAGKHGTNGGGALGDRQVFGFLMNVNGPSKYNATWQGTNGGGSEGSGFLADLGSSSNDEYFAAGYGTNGGAQYGLGFVPPRCQCATGFLLDAGGTDNYYATSQGTNGGANQQSVGFLLDNGGSDETFHAGYTTTSLHGGDSLSDDDPGAFRTGSVSSRAGFVGVNGGAFETAVGALINVGGSTTYVTGDGAGANGGAFGASSGLLVDTEGGDSYKAAIQDDFTEGSFGGGTNIANVSAGSNGGGAAAGVGAIVDTTGDDDYIAEDGHRGGINGTNGGAWSLGVGGAGLAADLGGGSDETYSATSDDHPVTGANGGGSGFGQFRPGNLVTLGPLDVLGIATLKAPALRATGTLVNIEGTKTTYTADATGAGSPVAGVNGGAVNTTSTGVLVDISPDVGNGRSDMYKALDDDSMSQGENGGVFAEDPTGSVSTAGTGLLLDVGGSNDEYFGDYCGSNDDKNSEDTVVPKGNGIAGKGTAIAGAQIDSSLSDTNKLGCG